MTIHTLLLVLCLCSIGAGIAIADIPPPYEYPSLPSGSDLIPKSVDQFFDIWGTVIAGCALSLAIVTSGLIWNRRRKRSKENDATIDTD